MAKRTPLYEEHEKLNARIVEFAGWDMPVQYSGIREEHMAVRTAVGLFDVSHMGEIFVRGQKSLETLQWLTTNDVSKLKSGEAHYSLLPFESGGLVDDIIIYCLEPRQIYLVCVNASNADKDFAWMLKNNRGAEIKDESSSWGQIAVQGPKALQLADRVLKISTSQMKPFTFLKTSFNGDDVIVARTGYTGEQGVEVFVPNEECGALWRQLLEKGADLGVRPIGLGARDTLRTEMKYSLYGNEIDETTNPIEAGLGWVVKLDKGDFIGRQSMADMKANGVSRKLVGFKMVEKGIPRHGYKLFDLDGHGIGVVTSGTHSPSLNEPIGIGYVQTDFAGVGKEFLVEIRDRKVKARVVTTPFVKAGS